MCRWPVIGLALVLALGSPCAQAEEKFVFELSTPFEKDGGMYQETYSSSFNRTLWNRIKVDALAAQTAAFRQEFEKVQRIRFVRDVSLGNRREEIQPEHLPSVSLTFLKF